MTKHLPEWIMIRYSKIWMRFKEREFSREDVDRILPDDKAIAVFLSELRKSGWIELRIDQNDARKTIYKLKSPTIGILEEVRELSKK